MNLKESFNEIGDFLLIKWFNCYSVNVYINTITIEVIWVLWIYFGRIF